MKTKDHDTDPSTPASRRPSDGRAAVGSFSAAPEFGPLAATDPNGSPPMTASGRDERAAMLGPASSPPSAGAVRASAATSAKKDSVELLLDGMGGPRPDRTKTMPQTAGEASAAYHAEHVVRPARTAHEEEPKVMVERSPLAMTVRIERMASIRPGAAAATFVEPQPSSGGSLAKRVFLAVIAALLVVGAIFGVMLFTIGRRTPPPEVSLITPTAPPPAALPLPPGQTARVPLPTATIASAPSPPESASAAVEPAEPDPASSAGAAGHVKPAGSASGKPRQKPPTTAGTGTNLGEFKTSF